jgi:hypothetical protein
LGGGVETFEILVLGEEQTGKTLDFTGLDLGREFDLCSSFFFSSAAEFELRDSLPVSCCTPKASDNFWILFSVTSSCISLFFCWLTFAVVLAVPCEAFGTFNRVAPDSMDLPVTFSVEEWFNVPDKLREKPSRSALVMVSELQRSG